MQTEEPVGSKKLPLAARLHKGLYVAGLVVLAMLALLIFTPGSLLDKLFVMLSGLCPQRPAHSSFFAGQRLPMEARMVGIFAGFGVTLVYLWFIGRGRTIRLPARKFTLAAMALVIPMVLDGLNATFYDAGLLQLYEPQLFLRIITGTFSGIGLAILIQPFFNLLIWRKAYAGGPLRSWLELGGLLVLGSGLIAMALSEWPPFFWPMALLTVDGVFAVLVMLNLMIYVMLARRENRVNSPAEMLWPVSWTFLFSLAEMGLLAIVRLNLLGSPI